MPANATPVAGCLFQDTIDGYIPLALSLRHMLARHGFGAALVTLLHAPVMQIPDLAPQAPVPLRLPAAQSGLLHRLDAVIRDDDSPLTGVGTWTWATPDTTDLPPATRLAEPAFVRGIGLYPARDSPVPSAQFGPLQRDGGSDVSLLAPAAPFRSAKTFRIWSLDAPLGSVLPAEARPTARRGDLLPPSGIGNLTGEALLVRADLLLAQALADDR